MEFDLNISVKIYLEGIKKSQEQEIKSEISGSRR